MENDSIRVVSLSPAISRTLVDLEMHRHIVGRTPFCASLDRQIPVVGSPVDLDYERLLRLRPTHVLVQPPAAGIDPALLRLAAERGWSLHAWRLNEIDDIRTLLRDLPDALAEADTPDRSRLSDRAEELIAEINAVFERHVDKSTSPASAPGGRLRGRGHHVNKSTRGTPNSSPEQPGTQAFAGRTLLLVGLDPVTAFGRGTYLDELLSALGGTNVVDLRGYPQLSLEDVVRLDPAAIILVRPGLVEPQSIKRALGPLGRFDVAAVRDGRIGALGHPDALLPSSAVVGVAEALRDLLHEMREVDVGVRQSTGVPDERSLRRCVATEPRCGTLMAGSRQR